MMRPPIDEATYDEKPLAIGDGNDTCLMKLKIAFWISLAG